LAATSGLRGWEELSRMEYFRIETEALRRAHQPIEDGNHYGIAVRYASGSVLTGIRLQLRLGMQVED